MADNQSNTPTAQKFIFPMLEAGKQIVGRKIDGRKHALSRILANYPNFSTSSSLEREEQQHFNMTNFKALQRFDKCIGLN